MRFDVEARRYLQGVGSEVSATFVQNRMILSFEEYMEVFLQSPRTAGQERR